MQTSRPPIARCSVPSTSRFARSVPNARKRPVESSKSYGSGKRSSNVVQRVERLVGHALVLKVQSEAVAREDAVAGEGCAAVGPPVADEHDRACLRQRAPLA